MSDTLQALAELLDPRTVLGSPPSDPVRKMVGDSNHNDLVHNPSSCVNRFRWWFHTGLV